MTTLHDFEVHHLDGTPAPLQDFAGQVVLVVNTASQCGFTPQYAGLEALYRRHAADGLVILGFPCNQFGHQEPGGPDEIVGQCLVNYGVSFPMFEKVEVNGGNAHPVFRWLKSALPGVLGGRIQWNFTKFLIGRDGKPLHRFAPITTPEKIAPYVRQALGV